MTEPLIELRPKTNQERQSADDGACPVKMTPAGEKGANFQDTITILKQRVVDRSNHNECERHGAADENGGDQPLRACTRSPRPQARLRTD